MNYTSFIHILTLAVICVGSCTESSEKNGIVPIREEILAKTIPEQVEMFQALTPELRCDLWRVKMANTLASKNLTKEEKAVIKPLAALLTPKAYFDEDTSDGLALREAAEEAAGRLTVHSYDIDPHSYDVDPLEEGRAFKEQSLFACKQAAA